MKVLVTGSAGHLGEAVMRTLPNECYDAIGLDVRQSPFTHRQGSILDRAFVQKCLDGVDAVVHTATLHKPHVATHARQAFIDTNITGTLNLLEGARAAGVGTFIFTSTTSVYGRVLTPSAGEPAAWITEEVVPEPKNIYGVTKIAAEQSCELFFRNYGLCCLILRTSRFFPEADDRKDRREAYDDANVKVNEFLYRRADIEDVAAAHILAIQKGRSIGFGRYIVSATTPFTRRDLPDLHVNAPKVVRRHMPRLQRGLRCTRLVHVPRHRPGIRQRACTGRFRLGAKVRLREHRRACWFRRGLSQRVGTGGRIEGLS
jgi:UDP-glucose 4-epimerase